MEGNVAFTLTASWPPRGRHVIAQVLRVEGNVAFTSDGTPQPNERKGEEVARPATRDRHVAAAWPPRGRRTTATASAA